MYASFRSVPAKNGKTLTLTGTGNFFVDLNGLGILRDADSLDLSKAFDAVDQ